MRIQNKLFAVLLSTSIVLVAITLLLTQWSVDRGMLNYVNTKESEKLQPLIDRLIDIYAEQESWRSLQQNPRQWLQTLGDSGIYRLSLSPYASRSHRNNKPIKRLQNIALIDQANNTVVGHIHPDREISQIAIVYQQQTIGWLILPKRKKITEGFELQFLEQQREAFIIIGLILITLTIAVSLPLAKHFVRPINTLVNGTKQLTKGNYQIQLDLSRGDEFGQLAKDFNQLAHTLASNEQNRKHWLADISHELRTPLAILKGEIEAIIDGIRPASSENLGSVQHEIDHLGKLVDDLYQLSNTQIGGLRYQLVTVELIDLLTRQFNLYHQATVAENIHIDFIHNHSSLYVLADPTRISQLIDNLLTNSLKYTDAGGTISVRVTCDADNAIIQWEDSAPGVAEEHLDKLFDHLYRVENSRNRNTGGSGLGLSICQQIIHAHNGTINAKPSALGGLLITFSLPLQR